MKEDKDILNIFKEELSQGIDLENSDWMKIQSEIENQSFYRWNIRKMNVYYLGMILLSFCGTFWLASDYVYTKGVVLTDYELRIKRLEERLDLLQSPIVVKKEVEEVKKVEVPNVVREENTVDKKVSRINTVNEEVVLIDKEDLSKIESKKESEEQLFVDSRGITDVIGEKLDTVKESDKLVEAPLVKIEKPELVKTKPVVIIVQDTIFEVDSVKISRRKLKNKSKD